MIVTLVINDGLCVSLFLTLDAAPGPQRLPSDRASKAMLAGIAITFTLHLAQANRALHHVLSNDQYTTISEHYVSWPLRSNKHRTPLDTLVLERRSNIRPINHREIASVTGMWFNNSGARVSPQDFQKKTCSRALLQLV